MTTQRKHYISRSNLSHAWAEALREVLSHGEAAPLIVSVTGFVNGVVQEDPTIRMALDTTLEGLRLQTCDTVAGTIFPHSLWNSAEPAQRLFDRYMTILPKLRKASTKNRRGLYFERLIAGGPAGNVNQLAFILSQRASRNSVRRSALQLAVFDASRDHSTAAQLGFPCLQHVTAAPTKDGLCINAFYATQYVVERAYGNYLGLCRLGRFLAHEFDMPLIRMTCLTGISLTGSGISKQKLTKVIQAIDTAVLQT